MEIVQGSVVIAGTGQAGTAVEVWGDKLMVLLTNGELWYGAKHHARLPQDRADLDAAPLEVERFEGRDKPLPPRPNKSRRDDFQD